MMNPKFLFSLLLGAVWMFVGAPGWAQNPPAAEAPASEASAPAPVASAAPPLAPASAPEPPISCAAATSRAMANDLKVAQSQGLALAELLQLQRLSLTHWQAAVGRCEGRARERAERLLADNVSALGRLQEREQAGAQCELDVRDANSMQELAKTAFGDRRWLEAGALFRKAETLWDLAAEHCTGGQQEIAVRRRLEAEIDGHNAEQCGPTFERSRDFTNRLRAMGAGGQPADRERASQIAETAWREASALCRGPAHEIAKGNAEALGRERGTPWVATLAPSTPTAQAPVRGSGFATAAAAVVAPPAPAPVTAPVRTASTATVVPLPSAVAVPIAGPVLAATSPVRVAEAAVSAARPVPQSAPPSAAEAAAPAALPAGEVELNAGNVRYVGRFATDAQQRVSGQGRVEWAEGDRYEGELRGGQRHGKGLFRWASGQTYEGDWLNDEPQGRGRWSFANGNRYDGDVQSGHPQGQGEMRYPGGDVYKGQWSRGQPLGRGVYRWANGQSFEGEWIGLSPQGRGLLRFANGDVYEGEVKSGIPEGKGAMKYANGGSYEGDFKAGVSHGQGHYRWPGGDRYEGAWVDGKKHGQGTFFFASGERWVGRFEHDERSDDGQFHGK